MLAEFSKPAADAAARQALPQPSSRPAAVRPIRSDARSDAGSLERTYLALLDSVGEIVWSGVADRGTVFVSGGVESISGFTITEVLALPGNPWIDRAHADDRARVDAAYLTATTGSPVAVEYRWQRKDGAWIWLRNRTSLRHAEGAKALDSFLSEITEQKRLQQQIRRLQETETETILVIEDSDETRTVLRRVLESLGYRVIEAATGHEALAACEVYVDRIDLVLSDVALADISGPEVVSRIQARRPRTTALFMSRHAHHALLRDRRLEGNADFIAKPFLHDAFAKKVREVLNAR